MQAFGGSSNSSRGRRIERNRHMVDNPIALATPPLMCATPSSSSAVNTTDSSSVAATVVILAIRSSLVLSDGALIALHCGFCYLNWCYSYRRFRHCGRLTVVELATISSELWSSDACLSQRTQHPSALQVGHQSAQGERRLIRELKQRWRRQ